MFARLEGDSVLLWNRGVFKVADLWTFEDGLYASAAGGYIRLYANGGTSRAGVVVKKLVTSQKLWVDTYGRLAISYAPDRKLLTVEPMP